MFRFFACPYTALSRRERYRKLVQSVGLRAVLLAMNDFTDLCSSNAGQQLVLSPGRQNFKVNAVTTETGLRGIVLRHRRCVEMARL